MGIKFDGDFTVSTSRADAYAILSDIEKFSPLLPTYVSHEAKDDGTVDVKIKVGVGKIRGVGTVNLQLTESNPPDRAAYLGKGKIMGSAFNLTAEFSLEDVEPGETKVLWQGEVTMFGKLVSLAGGMIQPIANKEIANLIETIRVALSSDAEAAPQEVVAPEKPSEEAKPGFFRALINKLKAIFGG